MSTRALPEKPDLPAIVDADNSAALVLELPKHYAVHNNCHFLELNQSVCLLGIFCLKFKKTCLGRKDCVTGSLNSVVLVYEKAYWQGLARSGFQSFCGTAPNAMSTVSLGMVLSLSIQVFSKFNWIL